MPRFGVPAVHEGLPERNNWAVAGSKAGALCANFRPNFGQRHRPASTAVRGNYGLPASQPHPAFGSTCDGTRSLCRQHIPASHPMAFALSNSSVARGSSGRSANRQSPARAFSQSSRSRLIRVKSITRATSTSASALSWVKALKSSAVTGPRSMSSHASGGQRTHRARPSVPCPTRDGGLVVASHNTDAETLAGGHEPCLIVVRRHSCYLHSSLPTHADGDASDPSELLDEDDHFDSAAPALTDGDGTTAAVWTGRSRSPGH
jgi:hypothetical protein